MGQQLSVKSSSLRFVTSNDVDSPQSIVLYVRSATNGALVSVHFYYSDHASTK